MTPQGRAIKRTSTFFGNGETLPFTPCKKGYIPMVGTKRRLACPLHLKAREKRLMKEKGVFRNGEVDLEATFWTHRESKLSSGNGKVTQAGMPTVYKNVEENTMREEWKKTAA